MHEEFFRKWLGINQQSPVSPLTLNMATGGKAIFRWQDKTLLELSQEEFEKMTANEIVAKLGEAHDRLK